MATGDDTASKANPARRRWLGRWLAKLLVWLGAMAMAAVLIAGLVALLAYHNLTRLANLAVARFAEPYRIELGGVEIASRGLIRMKEVRLRPPRALAGESDEPWAVLQGVDLAFDITELRMERRFRTMVLRGPSIRIDDASLVVLGLAPAGPGDGGAKATAPAPDLRHLGRLFERIEVVGGRLVIDTSRAPRIEGGWDVTIPAIDFGAEEWLNLEPFALRLSDLRVGGKLRAETPGRVGMKMQTGESKPGTIEKISLTGRVRSDLQGLEIGEIAVEAPKLTVRPDWLPTPRPTAATAPVETPGSGVPHAPAETGDGRGAFEILIGALSVKNATLGVAGFSGKEVAGPHLPDVAFTTDILWRGLSLRGGMVRSEAPLALALNGLTIGNDGPAALARIDRLALGFEPAEVMERGRVRTVEIDGPSLLFSPESMACVLPPAQTGAGPAEPRAQHRAESAAAPQAAAWEIGSLAIRGGSAGARGWDWAGKPLPAASVMFAAELRELSPASFASAADSTSSAPPEEGQSVMFRDLRIEGTSGSAAPVAIERLAARFRFGPLLRESRLDAVTVEKPVLRLTDASLPEWLGQPPGEAAPETPPGEAARVVEEPARVWQADELAIDGGLLELDTRALGGRLPKLEGAFTLAAREDAPADGRDRYFRLRFDGLRVSQPHQPSGIAAEPAGKTTAATDNPRAIAAQDVALVRQLTVDFSAAGLQRDRRIERIEVKGGEVQIGDALRELMGDPAGKPATDPANAAPEAVPLQAPAQPAAPAPATPQAAEGGRKPWSVGQIVVTESQVRFQALIPRIEGLEFALETKLVEVPLSSEGLLSQDQKQKIEIAGIEIRDPYDGFITVAMLPTIFVEFSLSGLLNRRIDKIDLINPAIHVGQGLFWWVDYQRNFRKQNEGVSFGGAGAAPIAATEEGSGDWEIREINAHFGKIVVAPTGQPIGIVPFPFNASTNLNKGEIALKLQIPKEQQYVYQFPDLQLDLHGLEGKIEFNVPIRQQDNNLVQTFTLDRAVWKQHEAEKLFLTVTYDSKGIYGRFGGTAYDGYAEGQFNVYLDDVGRWDAWIAGTKMNMGPITEVLVPENFLMDGLVNVKLISEGRGLVFGETWGEVETLSPGRIDVTKFDELIVGLPGEWSQLKRSATALGLETLKNFAYDRGRADLYFVNRDGWLRLDLGGPSGSRKLEVYAHDWRQAPMDEPAAGEPVGQVGSTPPPAAPLVARAVEPAALPGPPQAGSRPRSSSPGRAGGRSLHGSR